MGIFDGIKANLRANQAQKNLERMAYKEEYNKNRIEIQKKKAKLDASKSLGLNSTGTKFIKPAKKKDPYPNIKTDSGFTYGGFK